MSETLAQPLTLREGRKNELAPRTIPLSEKAKKLYIMFHDHVEVNIGEGKQFASVQGFGAKAAEHAVRLAGVISVLNRFDATEISEYEMGCGISLAEYYLSEAVRLFGTSNSDPDIELAEKLLIWAQERGQFVSLTDISQRGPNPTRNSKMAQRAIAILEDTGWFVRIETGMKMDGAFRHQVWLVRK